MNKTAMDDVQFLALLVHRGHLARNEAEVLLPLLKVGGELDELLQSKLGWDLEAVEKLRRTRGGEVPEIPGYEVLGSLGTGGTADVFRVREKKTGETIALKVLKPAATRNAATRAAFVAEARLLEKLDHKRLVKGYGVARSGTTYFTRLECIEGRTLLETLDEGHAFAETVALRIILEAAEALAYLASQGVVHRDVKPGNLMLTDSGHVKLIDLGFAASPEAQVQAKEGTTSGTVGYISPEQAQGAAAADLRSDIYSLGVTLFHLVVGRLPFSSTNDSEMLRMQVMQSLSSAELKSRGFSPHLHYFIEKMMAKDAEHRYQSWPELIDDIKGQIEGREKLDFDRDTDTKKSAAPRRRKF
ncbi:MAG: serine/threonine protein kinase [Planctomycetes bacterium]|nr:serine/threonine protein kinase [Planctomycetota bacterium]